MTRALAAIAALALLVGLAPTRGNAQIGSAQIGNGRPRQAQSLRPLCRRAAVRPRRRHATLELRFHIVQDYHVNSHTPKSQLLIPTTLTLQPVNGVKTAAIEYPAGKPYSFSFDPKDVLEVYAGDFTLSCQSWPRPATTPSKAR